MTNRLTKRPSRLKGIAAIALSVGLLASACGGGGTDAGGGDGSDPKSQPIDLGYIDWNEDIALNYLWKHILEERGYKVNFSKVDAGIIFNGMTKDEVDVFFDTWLPATHETYWKRHGDKLEKLTKWYETAPLALAVPKWTYNKGVQSIGDLAENADLFNGQITGIGPSAGETELINKKVMPAYNLKDSLTHKVTSASTMLAALDEAVQNKDDIVVALWKPHWAWSAYPIKPLKDPKNAWGKPDSIWATASGKNAEGGAFSEDYPKVAGWISKMKLTPEQIASLADAVVNKAEGEKARTQAAAKWAHSHQDLLSKWGIPKPQQQQ